MDVTQIAFNHFLGLETKDGALALPDAPHYQNHLGTVHASAQFALAEAASGLFLAQTFADIATGVIPVLRRSELKYKAAAKGPLTSRAHVSDEQAATFRSQLSAKGRASLAVEVEVLDESGKITLAATMEWFVQRASS